MAPAEDRVRLTCELAGACGGEVDELGWRLDPDGLQLFLVNAGPRSPHRQGRAQALPGFHRATDP